MCYTIGIRKTPHYLSERHIMNFESLTDPAQITAEIDIIDRLLATQQPEERISALKRDRAELTELLARVETCDCPSPSCNN